VTARCGLFAEERKRLQRLQKQKDKGRHQPNDNDDETEDAFDNKWTAGGLQAGVVPKAAVPAASAAAVSSSAAAVSSSAAAVSSSAAASKQLMSLDFLCSDGTCIRSLWFSTESNPPIWMPNR